MVSTAVIDHLDFLQAESDVRYVLVSSTNNFFCFVQSQKQVPIDRVMPRD